MLKKIGSLTVADVFTKGASYLLLPVYLGVMPQEEFGEFSFITTFISPIFLIVSFSLYVPFIRNYCSDGKEDKSKLISSIFNSLFIWLIIINIFFVLLKPILINHYINLFHITDFSDEKYYLVILLINTGTILLYCYSLLIGRNSTNEIIIFMLSKFLLISISSLAFIYFNILGDETVLNRLFGIFSAELLIALIYIFIYVKPHLLFKIDFSILKNNIKVALPLVPLALIGFFIVMIDRSLISEHHGLSTLASYSLAMVALTPIQMIMTSVQVAWAPHLFSLKNTADAMQQTKKIMWIACLVMVVGACLLALAIYLALYFKFIGSEYDSVPVIIAFASVGVIASALVHLNSNMFVHLNKTGYQLVVGLIVLFINWRMNISLIPEYSFYGAAISAGVANVAGLSIGLLLLRRIVNNKGV